MSTIISSRTYCMPKFFSRVTVNYIARKIDINYNNIYRFIFKNTLVTIFIFQFENQVINFYSFTSQIDRY